jgi:hypothetical protein
MDPTRTIKARVGAARILLEQHVAGSAIHVTVSRLQTAAIIELIGQSALSNQVKADLSTTVLGMKLNQPDMQAILEALSEGVAVSLAKRRRVQQNWMAVHNYGTAEFWARLQDPVMPGSCKLNLILQLAIGLGCRLPTEPSIKWMTSWWLAVAESPEHVAMMDGAAKKTMLGHVKATFDGLRKAAGDPVVFLDKLPDNPVAFLRDSPGLYHGCFMADPPVVPAMSIQIIAAIDMSYGCRGGATKLQPQASTTLAVPAVSLQLGDSPMERMASMMFQRMEAMATSQQRIMEMAMGATPSHRANPRPLAALADSSPLMYRKLPTIGIGGPLALSDAPGALAFHGASASSAESPPPKAPGPIIESLTPTTQNQDGEAGTLGAEEVEEECAESADLARMLDMLASRKSDNKDKGKGKGIGKDSGESTAEGAGEGTGKTGGPKGKGICKAGGPKGKGKITLKVKSKPKAKAKAASKAAAKAAGKPAVLGCSKCRWSKGGCTQCKDPEFHGHRYS